MAVKNLFLFVLAAIAGAGAMWIYTNFFERAAPGPTAYQQFGMLTQATEAHPAERIVPSIETILEPGQELEISEYPVGEINIQRLGENTYWILHNLHAMTLYVGQNEVLLIDAADSLFADRLLDRIQEITPNPLTTLVYTHIHQDHIGGAGRLVKEMTRRGMSPLRIVASEAFVHESVAYQQQIPTPTETVKNGRATFEFDGETFIMATPVRWAHSGADSYIITPDKVITFIDFVHTNRLPLHDVSGVQNMRGYIDFLRHVMGEDWESGNFGHIQPGNRAGVQRTLDYFQDLYDIWFEVIPDHWSIPAYLKGKARNEWVAIWLRNTFNDVTEEMVIRAEPKWGKFPQWELAREHAEKVHWDGFLNYNFVDHPDIRPAFDPIPPTAESVERPTGF